MIYYYCHRDGGINSNRDQWFELKLEIELKL